MVARQLRRRGIHDERVLAAMAAVPRELFLPPDQRRRAYRDGAVRIGEGQTMSQPWIVACMAQLLELDGSETVLEVGTGSGYAAAVLSRLAREVITIERYESLAVRARADPARARLRQRGGAAWATARSALPIALRSAASRSPPRRATSRRRRSLEQLAPGAALVCPVERDRREHLICFRDGEEEVVTGVRFVPLVTGDP